MVGRKETHQERAIKYAGIASSCGLVAAICWRFGHRPFGGPLALVFAAGVLGGLTAVIMSAGAYVLFVLEKRKG